VAPSAEQPSRTDAGVGPEIARFLGEPTRELGDWRWLWDGDHRFPVRSHRGLLGRFVVFAKRLLRPFVAAPQADLWERQRIFNLIALEYLQRGEDIRRVVLETHGARLDQLERVWREGLNDVMAHNDALFARVDQKLDRYRHDTRELWGQLGAALARVQQDPGSAIATLAEAHSEIDYVEFEARFRGTGEEIERRLERYLPLAEEIKGRGPLLDLGCGRGEALALFTSRGVAARGVDSSERMVELCRARGLQATTGDAIQALEATPAGTLGGVVSFHVVEHLPVQALDRLVRAAFVALAPGGVMALETPNPLSLVVAARNFWLDPTHLRPIHPDALESLCQRAGFAAVERWDLQPFPASVRLPEIPLDAIVEAQRPLADRINRLRDHLDDLLYGFQDYAIVARKGA
jgi:SAM-dependent methyltransferase